MARATAADVRTLTELPASVDVDFFVESASVYVDSILVSSGLSEAVLTQIETYIAAHFTIMTYEKGGIRRKAVGESSESYQTISERLKGLALSRFGQQAIAFDTTGVLASQGNANSKAEFRVV